MKNRILKMFTLLFCIIIIMNVSNVVMASEEQKRNSETMNMEEIEGLKFSDGERDFGALYGAQYSETDTSEWLTLQLGGRGLRIINNEGNDVVLVDQFGAVYINGQLCSPNNDDSETKTSSFSFGFMYFLIVISLILGITNIVLLKKK